ncbi:hypothetical protein OK348_05210 [Flavobacterium sp. MXW15]|uniref:DUF4124 domain-containing protein n=1 Tax=Xanthomonas chitinilytica TaxID=2989819 RepID=A0ABT3JSF1_9XANT|nr:hypothetical protein [Xanthomonas sp. H13-6]MCW4454187.1 hypothetical protein [Flavobacterium sp. MXW15]MCW4471421.1 hypothetical protein [Xanthomonas sp. H13-6]
MRTLPLLSLLCAGLLSSPPASAQPVVNRCTNAQGDTVFSDRRCEDLGATARLPATQPAGSTGLYRDGCTRRLSELTWQIRAAIEARDVNQLSGIYLWNGVSNAAAGRILDRLEAIVQRPLVDIAPVYPEPVAEPALPETAPPSHGDGLAGTEAQPLPLPPPAAAPSPAQRRPIGLRLEQTLANGSTPSRTVLGLRRQYNCFWISL